MATWDLKWYDLFCGDVWQRLEAALRLNTALDSLGFPDDENTLSLVLGE